MNTPRSEFEKIKFSSFNLQNIMLKNDKNPDDFFNTNQFPDTNYFMMAETKSKICGSDGKSFWTLDLNVKSVKKDLEKLANFWTTLSFNFKVISISKQFVSKDLGTNNEDVEAICIEIINVKNKKMLVNTIYRQPAGWYNEFETS